VGVISLATSGLTGRTGHFGASDQSVITAIANQVAIAIDDKMFPGPLPSQTRTGRSEKLTQPPQLAWAESMPK
jgi:hypothetical protein